MFQHAASWPPGCRQRFPGRADFPEQAQSGSPCRPASGASQAARRGAARCRRGNFGSMRLSQNPMR
eukprot:7356-Chlamydomonas_euryale.AAC.1